MKKTVLVKYADFVEVFEALLEESNLKISLNKIANLNYTEKDSIVLDLAGKIREDYSIFPFETGDLSIIQIKNVFIVSVHTGEKIHWVRFNSSQLISYLMKDNIIDKIVPYINDDENIFLNSVLSDCIRTDYSFDLLNKKVKFGKIAILMHFIDDLLKVDFKRVLLDETVIGDVEIENIAMAFRFAGKSFLKLVKIDNLTKVILTLEKEKCIKTNFKFQPKVFFINNQVNSQKMRLVFGKDQSKFDYEIFPQKNYVFDLGEKEFALEFDHLQGENVTGKVCIFNGDERDLMIN